MPAHAGSGVISPRNINYCAYLQNTRKIFFVNKKASDFSRRHLSGHQHFVPRWTGSLTPIIVSYLMRLTALAVSPWLIYSPGSPLKFVLTNLCFLGDLRFDFSEFLRERIRRIVENLELGVLFLPPLHHLGLIETAAWIARHRAIESHDNVVHGLAQQAAENFLWMPLSAPRAEVLWPFLPPLDQDVVLTEGNGVKLRSHVEFDH